MTTRRTNRCRGRDPFVCYLACRCCGHWWPLTEKMFLALLAPMFFVCPFCAQGRKQAAVTWDWDKRPRRTPIPEILDVRVADKVPSATVAAAPPGATLFEGSK